MEYGMHDGGMTLQSLAPADSYSAKIARQIRMRLAELGQNQAALARALDVNTMWVSDRMTGRVQISANDLPRFAEALGVEVVDLLPRVTTQYPLMPHIPAQRVASTPVPHIAARLSTPIPGLRRTQLTGR